MNAISSDLFLAEQGRRTAAYLGRPTWEPARVVRVRIGDHEARNASAQFLLLTLANMLARIHRTILVTMPLEPLPLQVASLVPAANLQEGVLTLMRSINPFGTFELSARGGDFVLAIDSAVCPDAQWYLGARGAVGHLSRTPIAFLQGNGGLLGAGVAACLGAAAATKAELGLPIVPRQLSSWNYCEGTDCEGEPPSSGPIDVGHVLMVGAGAVAAAAAYFLWAQGVGGSWTIVDEDIVELHNTNRGLVFFPSHSGRLTGSDPAKKVDVIAELLPNATPLREWYDKAAPAHENRFDVVLALANDRDVRYWLAHRNSPVLLQATTGENWLSQLHRHVAGRDDCAFCRTGELAEPAFGCSSGAVGSIASGERMDASLPFLSGASGLMLASALQRLQFGALAETTPNQWNWDFLSAHRMSSAGRARCGETCGVWYPASVRRRVYSRTRWAHLEP